MEEWYDMTTNILGTEYKIEYRDYDQDPSFKDWNVCGYCEKHMKLIVVGNMKTFASYKDAPSEVIDNCEKEIIRHEVIHAYLNESGLQDCADSHESWANNDEMVDWFAIQGPKIMQTWIELDCVSFKPTDGMVEYHFDITQTDIKAIKDNLRIDPSNPLYIFTEGIADGKE